MVVETGRTERPQPTEEAPFDREDALLDYRIAVRSREASLLGRKEVLTGKAKFGIFGDGKEVAQVAMARAFRPGDWRAGYYRDQTFMMALGLISVQELFAQLYANPDVEADPSSAGRQMNAHFATRFIDDEGRWKDQVERYNVSADISPTAGQMPRLVGLAYASRLYREVPGLDAEEFRRFSDGGREIAFGTIGNASCAEGLFWEAINAVGVLGAPLLMSIWDDGYGISVPNEHQITKGNLSEVLWGFQRGRGDDSGYNLHTVSGWDYPTLVQTYAAAADRVRQDHVPTLLHVVELTQPQGHSTSGSHERYKSEERLAWEREWDCLVKMRAWMVEEGIAGGEELDALEAEEKQRVRDEQRAAWDAYRKPIDEERQRVLAMLSEVAAEAGGEAEEEIAGIAKALGRKPSPFRRDLATAAREALLAAHVGDAASREAGSAFHKLARWDEAQRDANTAHYDAHLHAEGAGLHGDHGSALHVEAVAPRYADDAEEVEEVNGFEILNRAFDAALGRHPELIAFGEDVGKLGDVNQGLSGMQEKYGRLRVADTGIREATILGQAIGMAMRGLRPVAEIQYLDYVLYAIQTMSDDLATLSWRSAGGQRAPVIVRTRGHRLEGIWHSGSPMAGLLGLLRGMWLCVPRDMTQAAGMYNTLLAADDPALVIEVLNGYRSKEPVPENLADFRLALGEPEVLRQGGDVTVVTYGASCRIAAEAAEQLARVGIEVEIIDVQTLLPFDLHGRIVESLKKTSRVVFFDEDVPGGATAFMLQQVVEKQRGFLWLDSEPKTVTARAHRPAYGSDGDYFSKPNREDLFAAVYGLMHEADPGRFPLFWRDESDDR